MGNILNSLFSSMFLSSIAFYLGMGDINMICFIISGNWIIVQFLKK